MNFKSYEKEISKFGYLLSGEQVIDSRGNVVALLDKHGDVHSKDEFFLEVLVDAVYSVDQPTQSEEDLFKAEVKVAKSKRSKRGSK